MIVEGVETLKGMHMSFILRDHGLEASSRDFYSKVDNGINCLCTSLSIFKTF